MKPSFFAILVTVIAFQSIGNASEPKFYTAYGQYVLSPDLTLIISEDTSDHQPKYMLMQATGGGGGQTLAVTNTLWWATSLKIGYYHLLNPTEGTNSEHDRAEPFHDYDKFPPRPAVFITEINHQLPVKP
jgi:hypothetical protein